MAERSTKKTVAPHWVTLAEASSPKQGWTKHTRAMAVDGGTLYQTATEHRAAGAQGGKIVACSEALVFVPSPVAVTGPGVLSGRR